MPGGKAERPAFRRYTVFALGRAEQIAPSVNGAGELAEGRQAVVSFIFFIF